MLNGNGLAEPGHVLKPARNRGINNSSEVQIPPQESYRNVRLVNYLKFCAGSEALSMKPIRDEGLFARCQERNVIKKTPALCQPAFRPFPANPVFRVWLMDGPPPTTPPSLTPSLDR